MKVTSDNGGGLEEKLGRAWRGLKNGVVEGPGIRKKDKRLSSCIFTELPG